MTNLEWIKGAEIEELAKLLVYSEEIEEPPYFVYLHKLMEDDLYFVDEESAFYDCMECLAKVHKMKCKDCFACNKIGNKYECWGVKEPFEIKDINQYCTEH